MDKYTQDLIAHSKGEITPEEIRIPESIKPLTKVQYSIEIQRIIKNPSMLDKLFDFLNFCNSELTNLNRYSFNYKNFTVQQAFNYSFANPVSKLASQKLKRKEIANLMLLKKTDKFIFEKGQNKKILNNEQNVSCLTITSDGRNALTGNDDGTCIFWKLDTGEPVHILSGHKKKITSVNISPNKEMAISCSEDKKCILWNLKSGKALLHLSNLKEHINQVYFIGNKKAKLVINNYKIWHAVIVWNFLNNKTCYIFNKGKIYNSSQKIAFTPDIKKCIVYSDNSFCSLWDLEKGKFLRNLKGIASGISVLKISKNGALALAGLEDKTCVVWDLNSGELIQKLKGHKSIIRDVEISSDCKKALSGSDDNTCILWNLENGDKVKTLRGHNWGVNHVSFTPDSKNIITNFASLHSILWNTYTGNPLIFSTPGKLIPFFSMNGERIIIETTTNKKTILKERTIAANFDVPDLLTINFYNIKTGKTDYSFTCNSFRIEKTYDEKWVFGFMNNKPKILINCLNGNWVILKSEINSKNVFSFTRNKLLIGSQNSSILMDFNTGTEVSTFKGHNAIVNCVATTPDGKYAISGSNDNTCIIWDLITQNKIITLKEHTDAIIHVAISPTGKQVITQSKKETLFWSLETDESPFIFSGHYDDIYNIIISPNWERAITCSANTIVLWDLKNQKKTQTLIDAFSIYSLSGIIFPNSSLSLCETPTFKIWELWDFKKQKKIYIYENLPTRPQKPILVHTPDNKFAFTVSYKCIHMFNLKTGKIDHIPIEFPSAIKNMVVTADGRLALFTLYYSSGNVIHFYDMNSGKVLISLIGHNKEVKNIDITPDGKFALSYSEDRLIFWELDKGFVSIQPEPQNNFFLTESSKRKKLGHWALKRFLIDWETNDFLPSEKINHTFSLINCLDINPSNTHAVLCGTNVNSLDAFSDNEFILCDLRSGNRINNFKGHTKFVFSVEFTHDGKHVVSYSTDNSCIVWDISTGKITTYFTIKEKTIKPPVTISPDGNYATFCNTDNSFALWNIKTGELIINFEGHSAGITTIVFTPDNKNILTGSVDKTCILWEIKTGRAIHKLTDFDNSVSQIVVAHNGKHAVSITDSNTVNCWNLESGKRLAVMPLNYELEQSKILHNDSLLIRINEGAILSTELGNLFYTNYAIATIRQIWSIKHQSYGPCSVDCPSCGHHFEPPHTIIQSIIQILQNAEIQPEQSACLGLPDEAWEYPGLIGECPGCHEPLKFNPFFGSGTKDIIEYYSSLERELKYQEIFVDAENAFKEEDWDNAYNLYLKLVQNGKFDENYMRFNMALCRLNQFTDNNQAVFNDIIVLLNLLKEKGANDKVEIVSEKLNEKFEDFKKVEIVKKKALPWWKKIF
jgi:WD40 repeat protein